MNVPASKRNPQFARLFSNIYPQLLERLLVCNGELYVLADKVIELESSEVGRDILCCSEQKYNQ